MGASPLFICGKERPNGRPGCKRVMAVDLEQLRAAAQRVAASHGLDVVEIDFAGGGKFRALRVFIEKNAEGRAKLAEAANAARLAMTAGASKKRGADEAERLIHPGSSPASLLVEPADEEPAETTEASNAVTQTDDEIVALDEGVLPSAVLEGTLSIEHLSGVTHEDCEQFSRDFGVLLDVEDFVGGTEYTLEVSSPGLDRKLTRAVDYERFVGSLVKLQTFIPIEGNRHWKGRIQCFADGRLTLDLSGLKQKAAKGKGAQAKGSKAGKGPGKTTGEGASARVEIDFGNVEKANLVPEF